MRELTQGRGLVDLHRHLDGSLRRETALELARALGVSVPRPLEFQPGMGLGEALARFGFTLALLESPEAVRRVAGEMCEDAAAEGVTTLEVRFAPQLHRGAPLGEVVDAALEGLAGRAGLILCGLYGESPDLLGRLVEVGEKRQGVVGLDLAGAPLPAHRYRLVDYADAFATAGAAGLGRTVHAGEGRPAAEIALAIERLGADRVGHGVTLLDDPEVLALALERQVTIEACLTSNVQTGAIASVEAHPLASWLEAGVRACVCADNTLFSGTTAARELELAATIPGMTPTLLERALAFGHRAAFGRDRPPAALSASDAP